MRLRATLGDDALWIPPRLWAYAADNQPDGDFSGYSDQEVAMLIGYSKDATSMLQALTSAGFLDTDRKIHDWAVHSGFHEMHAARAKKAADARWNRNRSKQSIAERTGAEQSKHSASIPQACLEHASSIDGEVLSFEQVKARVFTIGIPDDFIHWVYDDWFGRQGKDGAGVHVPVLDYVKKRWYREQTEWRAGTHKGNRKVTANGTPIQNGVPVESLQEKLDRQSLERIKRQFGGKP